LDYNFFQDYAQPKRRVKRKKPPAPEDDGGEVFPRKPKDNETRTDWLPCDRKITLFGFNHRQGATATEDDKKGNVKVEDPAKECSVIRPSQVSLIPHSNLLLVVVDTAYPSCYIKFSTKPEEINIDDPRKEMYHCHKLALGNLTRRRMSGCFSHHPEVSRSNLLWVAVINAKNHKRQRRKRQSVTAKREKSQTPKVLTAILNLPNLT